MAAKHAARKPGASAVTQSGHIGGRLFLGLEDEHRASIDADADLTAERRRVAFLDACQERRVEALHGDFH